MYKAYTREDVVALIKRGDIKTLSDIFYKYKYPISRAAPAVSSKPQRLANIVSNPIHMDMKEVRRLADYFQVEYPIIQKLVNTQIDSGRWSRLYISTYKRPKEEYPLHIKEMLDEIREQQAKHKKG